jgi:hypothetical protein
MKALLTVHYADPEWHYFTHWLDTQGSTHYIEIAKDEKHRNIKRITISHPRRLSDQKRWYEFCGIDYTTIEQALTSKQKDAQPHV